MSLRLGKKLNRTYGFRLPFNNGFYNIIVYLDKGSTFSLFSIDPDFGVSSQTQGMVKMFKNIEAAKFCDIFVKLHNFKKETLDIVNQYDSIKPDYTNDITMVMNETITLSKIKVNDKDIYDTMNLYGFTILPYVEEYFFMIAERHSIMKKLGKKVVRTIGLQISTPTTSKIIEEYYDESKNTGLFDYRDQIDRSMITKLDD
jgi:hypothetical protein